MYMYGSMQKKVTLYDLFARAREVFPRILVDYTANSFATLFPTGNENSISK